MRKGVLIVFLAAMVGYLWHISYQLLPQDQWDPVRYMGGLIALFLISSVLDKAIERRAKELAARSGESSDGES